MKKISYFLILIFLLGGCGSGPQLKQQELPPISVNAYSSDDLGLAEQQIVLRGMRGPYPETIKDKKLGKGLLNNEYKKIKDVILNNLKNQSQNVSIKIVGNSNDSDVKKIINGMKIYFNRVNNFVIIDNNSKYPDVIVKVVKDKATSLVHFEILFKNPALFREKEPKYIKVKKTLKEYEKEASSFWSRVEIPTVDGDVAVYEIMKRPVLESEFYPNKITKTPKAATSVSFDEADEYCFKKYGGSVSTLYVFEFALRKGLIIPATKYQATREFVAPFDPADEEDVRLKEPGDIVYLKNNECEKILDKKKKAMCYAENQDYSIVYDFNFNTKRYEITTLNGGVDITFRCIRKGEK